MRRPPELDRVGCVPGSPGLVAVCVGCPRLSRPSHQMNLHTFPKMGGKGQKSPRVRSLAQGSVSPACVSLAVVADMLSHEGYTALRQGLRGDTACHLLWEKDVKTRRL